MPGSATTYWSSTIVDASPDHANPITIAQLSDVAANTYGQHVSVMATVTITTGADTDGLDLALTLNSATGTQIGALYDIDIATPETAGTYSFQFTGQLPLGTHTLCLVLVQTGASVDATVSAVTLVGLVGD